MFWGEKKLPLSYFDGTEIKLKLATLISPQPIDIKMDHHRQWTFSLIFLM